MSAPLQGIRYLAERAIAQCMRCRAVYYTERGHHCRKRKR